MEQEMELAIRVGIYCQTGSTVRQVYFRAGLPIVPGKSEMVVSPEQCATLENDPRLVVVRLAENASLQAGDAPSAPGDLDATLGVLTGSGYLAGVATLAGKVTPLAEMKVDELRELALQMGIPEAAKLKKAELVTAIAATDVQYPVKDEQSSGQNGEQ
ncbi:Rho termination factor N-terminal domain-containing protein [Aeromonas veronii]|uniref:Rho termination factor N-terminal domain-containing protein n=1 Tax=Aeromonas veronii TaxID=654 RepID=UPI003F742D3C